MRYYIVNLILFFLPASRLYALKRALLRFAGARVAKNVRVMRIRVQGISLSIGEGTFIGDETMLAGSTSRVSIGRNCDISARVTIHTGTHAVGTIERAAGDLRAEDITIEDGVWVGVGATILAGVTIGKGSIIAAGSVVNKSIPSGVLAAGVPATVKKQLYTEKSQM